jgi:telomerase reverse transcriptase
MDIFQIPWAKIKFNKKYKGLIIARGRNILSGILILFYNQLIIPLLKHNFYITEKHR